MFTNINKQIGLSTESRSVEFLPKNSTVASISAYLFKKYLLINIEDDSLLNLENLWRNNMLQSIKFFNNNIQENWNDENYYGYVYLIYDQKNNKIYIGQKKGKIKDSLNYYGSGTIIQNIIKKRGTYFLKKIILGVCQTKEELTEQETECKYFFYAFDRKYGYNIAVRDMGGAYLQNHPNRINIIKKIRQKALFQNLGKTYIQIMKNEEKVLQRKLKFSNSTKGDKHYKYNKTYEEIWGEELSNQIKQKQSEKVNGKNNGFYNKHHTKETIKILSQKAQNRKQSIETIIKISKSSKGRIPWNKGISNEKLKIKLNLNEFLELIKLRFLSYNIKQISEKYKYSEPIISRYLKLYNLIGKKILNKIKKGEFTYEQFINTEILPFL